MKKGEPFLRSCCLGEREIYCLVGQFIAQFTFEYLGKLRLVFWIVALKLNILGISSTHMSTGYNYYWILPGLFFA